MMARLKAPPALLLELGPALMMGLAGAFLFAVAPGEVLERVVVRSGLPALLPRAEPPLGGTARVMLAVLALVAGTAAVWFVLRRLGRQHARPRARAVTAIQPPVPPADAAPTLRRADRHPDAPAKRPLSAAGDLAGSADLVSAAPAFHQSSPLARDEDGTDTTVAALLARLEAGLALLASGER